MVGSSGSPSFALIDNNFKFMTSLSASRSEDLLFDLEKDPAEKSNIVEKNQDIAQSMKNEVRQLMESFERSHAGADYKTSFTPVNEFPKRRIVE